MLLGKPSQHDPLYNDYMSPAEDDDDDDNHKPASSDLSDYLSHSIFFDHSIDSYTRGHEKQKQKKTTGHGSQGPKV
jgi:hypothetical protein